MKFIPRHLGVWVGLSSSLLNGCLTSESVDSLPQTGECSLDGLSWKLTPEAPVVGRSTPYIDWTGSRVVVWGGRDAGGTVGSGFFYDPTDSSFSLVSTQNAPSSRVDSRSGMNTQTGQWLLWGGRHEVGSTVTLPATGAILDVSANEWHPVMTNGAPTGRAYVHLIPFNTDQWIIWGGNHPQNATASDLQVDARVLSACWSHLKALGDCPYVDHGNHEILTQRKHGAVHSFGSGMIAWSGGFEHQTFPNDGAIYDFNTASWRMMSSIGAPPGREMMLSAVGNGKLFVFGGAKENTQVVEGGGIYDIASDKWESLPTENAPSGRLGLGFWIKERYFAVLGGGTIQGGKAVPLADSALYDTVTKKWIKFFPADYQLTDRMQPNMTWTGSQMFLWGGIKDFNTPEASFPRTGVTLTLPDCL